MLLPRCVQVTGVGGRMTDSDFTPEEETKFRNMVAQPDFAAKLYRSVGESAFEDHYACK